MGTTVLLFSGKTIGKTEAIRQHCATAAEDGQSVVIVAPEGSDYGVDLALQYPETVTLVSPTAPEPAPFPWEVFEPGPNPGEIWVAILESLRSSERRERIREAARGERVVSHRDYRDTASMRLVDAPLCAPVYPHKAAAVSEVHDPLPAWYFSGFDIDLIGSMRYRTAAMYDVRHKSVSGACPMRDRFGTNLPRSRCRTYALF